jgi:MFS family permease
LGEDFKAIAQGLAKDVAKLGINMKDIKIPSTLTLGPLVISDKQPSNSSRPERPQNDHNIPNSRKLDGARSGSQQDSRNATLRPVASVKESSPRSSITSIDAFPHVVHSEEVAAKEADPQLFSATVVTNFSLPGPKARRSNAGKPFSRQHSTNQPPLIEDVVREADVEASHTEVLQTASESQLSSAYEVARKQSVFQCRVEGGSNDPQSLDEASSSSARKMRPGRVRTNIFAPKSLDEAEEDVDEIDKQGIMVQTEIDVEEGDASEEEEDKGTMSTEELKASGQQGITVQVDLDIEEDKVEEGVEEDGGQTVSEEAAESTPPDQDPVETKPKAESSELDQEDSTGTAVIPDDAVGDDSSAVPEQENTNSFENQTLVKPSISKGSESTDLSMLEALPSPVVGHLTNLKNAIEFVDNVRGRMQDVEKKYEKKAKLQDRQAIASNDLSKQQNDDTVSPQPKSKSVGQPVTGSPRRPASPETSTHSLTGIDIAINVDKTLAKHPLLAASSRTSPKLGPKAIAGQDVVEAAPARASPSKSGSALLNIARPSVNRPSQLLDVDPLDSAYWGFVPAVKEAVQDAVQVAVRNAVHEIVVPPGVEQDTASDAYRKLVADSLSQAAKNADDYLRRASLWNEPSSSPRLPEAGVQSPRLWQKDRPRDVSQNKSENALLYHQENNNRPRRSNSSTGRYGNSSTAAPSNPQSPSSIGLETVPLDQQPEPDNQKRESRFSASWKKGAPAGYDAIPTRKSSRNHVLGPKSSSTNSSQRVSPKNPRSRGRSYERLASRSQGLRSISSVGSLENPDAYPKAQREDELGRNNTVHWLKELLSNDKPYEPRLTALPPRARRGENRSTGRIRSQTAPMKPVDELFLGATPEPAEDLDIPKSNVDKLAPETFTRTINDLENLLNEALLIARQAADREDAAKVPAILEDATKVLKDQRKVLSEESLLGRATRDQIRSRAFDRRGSDDISSVPSIHESLRSYSGSSASEFSDDDETAHENQLDIENANRGRNVTVSSKETGSNHPSGWPPTGRSSTPYPPESQPASGKSITVDTPLMEENISNDSVGHIRAADPRSMPAETGLSPRKSSAASKPYTPGPLIQRVSTSFTTLEPFGNTTSSGIKRESSAKSPGRVSPVKKSPGTRDSAALQDAPYNGSVPLPRADSSAICKRGHSEDEHDAIKARMSQKSVPSKREVRKHIKTFRNPPIQPRASSLALRKQAENSQGNVRGYQVVPGTTFDWQDIDHDRMEPCSQLESEAPASAHALQEQKPSQGQLTGTSYSRSLDGTLTNSEEIDFSTGFVAREHGAGQSGAGQGQAAIELKDKPDPNLPPTSISRRRKDNHHDLRGKTHVSLREHKGFSLARSHKRQTIARDWSPSRKRFSAAVACISTALVGILVGIYAGEVPAIQYYIVDFHHYTVLGNVFFFIALAVPTFFFWPLPLLHGRKPYILGAMAIAMPLLFPQAIAVGQFRSPYVSTWRVGLILSRALMGFCLGFANMNFKSILTDLFGASLQSANPHQEVVDEFDVRRHGGGMGVWLGLWTWSAMGSIGVGFMAGAVIINSMTPAWGFYISIVIIAAVLLLNIITPEVRRSAYRRSVAEVRNGADVSRRLARGEVKMHMVQTGPKWWGEEFHYGVMLSAKMIRQPGFLVMSVYVAWMYAQIVLIIVVSNITQDSKGCVLILRSFLGL